MVKHNEKACFLRNGRLCTRKGFVCLVEEAEKFSKKCKRQGVSETRIMEKLIRKYNQATGWGTRCKQAPFFEDDPTEHVKDAVQLLFMDEGFSRN